MKIGTWADTISAVLTFGSGSLRGVFVSTCSQRPLAKMDARLLAKLAAFAGFVPFIWLSVGTGLWASDLAANSSLCLVTKAGRS